MPRFLHLRFICAKVSFLPSVRGENLIVVANINVEVYRLVNSIQKRHSAKPITAATCKSERFVVFVDHSEK